MPHYTWDEERENAIENERVREIEQKLEPGTRKGVSKANEQMASI